MNPYTSLREETGVRSMANLGSRERGYWLIGSSKLLMPLFCRPICANVATSSSCNEAMQWRQVNTIGNFTEIWLLLILT